MNRSVGIADLPPIAAAAGNASETDASPDVSVVAVVVTFNRRDLLEQTLESLKAQTCPVARIVVVDNCSTDGTPDFLRQITDSRIEIVLLERNTGGAGGFSAGIERAFQLGHGLIWVMDDDVLVHPNALEELIKALQRLRSKGSRPNFLISNVFNTEREPVNAPVIDLRLQPNGNLLWTRFLEDGVTPVVSASFVGTLIMRQAVERYGLPIAEMFIWGDDTEFTFRLTRDCEAGYVVGASQIVHLGRPAELSILQEVDLARAEKFFYFYRNNIYVLRKYGTKQARAAFVLRVGRDIYRLLLRGQIKKLFIVLHGIWSGITFNPPIRNVSN